MSVKIIPFALDHIDLINHKIKYPSILQFKADIDTYEEQGDKAITCVKDDKIIFSCGLKRINTGVAHVWVAPSIYCDTNKFLVYKTIKKLLDDHAEEFKLHRVQTTIEPEFIKWIEFLGFEKECVFRQVKADKGDLYFYVKFYQN